MSSWIHNLRSTELHRLAVLLGCNCSGTKSARIAGILDCLRRDADIRSADLATSPNTAPDRADVRLISVDMGIRNLAYAFFIAKMETGNKEFQNGVTDDIALPNSLFKRVTLQAWKKIDVSISPHIVHVLDHAHSNQGGKQEASNALETNSVSEKNTKSRDGTRKKAHSIDHSASNTTDAYHPLIYATHAYSFVQSILKHNPTHVIIERQRFRTGGGAGVQEWSLRVGMFESMLWASLTTLMQHGSHPLDTTVESILPTRVNRFWLEECIKPDGSESFDVSVEEDDVRLTASKQSSKITGRHMKKAKIMTASRLIDGAQAHGGTESTEHNNFSLRLDRGSDLQQMIGGFQSEIMKSQARRSKARDKAVSETEHRTIHNLTDTKITKLDDLADCFLQGLAWLRWKQNRSLALVKGKQAFDLK